MAMNRHGRDARRLALTLGHVLAAIVMVACGGGGGGGGSPFEPPPTDQAIGGAAVVKLRSPGTAWAALAERPRALEDNTAPDRHALLASSPGASPRTYRPPAGWSLIDLALHPSGELTMVLATPTQLRLVRLDAQAQPLSDAAFTDVLAATDPIVGSFVHDPSALLPVITRDAVRLAAQGEHLVMALRTGRHAVVAYQLQFSRGQGHVLRWRTLVEPGVEIDAKALTGGTFDPFGGLENPWHVALDVDQDGRVAVGVVIGETELLDGHRRHFNDGLPAGVTEGVLLTQLDREGRRLFTTLVDTVQKSELHGLRFVGPRIALVGRVRSEVRTDGSGWNAYLGLVSAGQNRVEAYRVIDVDRGDVLFDVAALADGRLLLAGTTGYVQNPGGRSISEAALPLLAVVSAQGTALQAIGLAAGPRHNQARALGSWGGRWWAGGMQDGPGTHSADADRSLLRADGYVRGVQPPALP